MPAFNTFANVAPPWSLAQLDANFADTAHLAGSATQAFSALNATSGNTVTTYLQGFGLGQTSVWTTFIDNTVYTNAAAKGQLIIAEFSCTSTGNVNINYNGSPLSGAAFSNVTGANFFITIPMKPGDTVSYHVTSGAYTVTGITFS